MGWKPIEQTQWEPFLTSFGRQHNGWLVSVECSDGDASQGSTTGRLREVKLEDGGVQRVVLTLTEGDAELAVQSPTRISLDEDTEGAHRSLSIEGESGQLRLTFRVAIPPEMVDGIL